MTAQTAREPMSRKRKDGEGRPQKTTTKLDAEVLRKARTVALYRDKELFDYLDAIVRPVVERDYHKMIEEEAKGEG